jgi:uncharacterized protein YndB with AHSA1/START domain
MQDVIEREIIVKATNERVYGAITDPKQIIAWFPDSVTGSLEVGGRAFFDFGEEGAAQVHIVAATPFEYFAYRWHPGKDMAEDVLAVSNTLVEFHIEETAEGTKVTVRESGFASLPADVAEKSLGDNTSGWKYMMDRLEELMNQA